MSNALPLEFRLSRLTVASLRNLCETNRVHGSSGLVKDELVRFVMDNFDEDTLDEFCTAQEEIYFVENMAKAIKWATNPRIVDIDPRSGRSRVDAVFTLRRSDGWEVYNIRFVNHTTEDVATSCECVDAREKSYFCAHQMAVLVRCLALGLFTLDQWTGPMTPEAEDLINANVFRKRRPAR